MRPLILQRAPIFADRHSMRQQRMGMTGLRIRRRPYSILSVLATPFPLLPDLMWSISAPASEALGGFMCYARAGEGKQAEANEPVHRQYMPASLHILRLDTT